jgi:Tfp pilus assembly protein PilV
MRKAFTLIEVNLAMLIMAGGILSIVGLYAFGYRENRQSREDVAATAVADAVISPLMMAITATNLKWSAFRDAFYYPDDTGWGAYFDNEGIVSQNPDGRARSAFNQTMDKMSGAAEGPFDCDTSFPSAAAEAAGLMCGLVVMHDKDSPIVRIGFRATSQPGTLLGMPLFYTEARFQGLSNK